MILSDGDLRKRIDSGDLVVDPLTEESIQPASIDCRLWNHFLIVNNQDHKKISMSREIQYTEIIQDKITLPPHSFILATTRESIKLPNDMIAFVEGRSSVGRMGLFIQNAGWVDPGFEGRITLELYNANALPIELEPGRRICQLVFGTMKKASINPYKGKYQGQKRSVGSKIWKDSENQ